MSFDQQLLDAICFGCDGKIDCVVPQGKCSRLKEELKRRESPEMQNINVFGALSKKRQRLLSEKREVAEQAQARIAEIDRELSHVDKAISTINEAIKGYLCQTCGGSGTVRRCDAAGQMEDEECPACKGTGIKT